MAVTLVTGGIRSGKSRHAEGLAGGLSDVTYVATGAPDGGGDQEWSRRLTPCFREVKLLSSRDTRPYLDEAARAIQGELPGSSMGARGRPRASRRFGSVDVRPRRRRRMGSLVNCSGSTS
jgi:hypothetical protein